MKPKIFILSILFGAVFTSAFAQKPQATAPPVQTNVHLGQPAHVLFVENDITVILTDDDTNDVTVEGDARDVKALQVDLNDGNLFLSSASAANKTGVKVYVPAKQLIKVHLSGKSILRSAAVLQNKSLKIVLDGEGIVNLSSTGKVVIEGTNDFDFVKNR